jgi:hypothetical protein
MPSPVNFINLVGKTFGELFIFERGDDNSDGPCFWGRCSCGDETKYPSKSIRDGIWIKCRACKKEDFRLKRIAKREEFLAEREDKKKGEEESLKGKTIHNWTVIKRASGDEFVCRCSCGNETNYSKQLIFCEKLSKKCKECRKRESEENKKERVKSVIQSEFGKCCQCDENINISLFAVPSEIKKGRIVCLECNKDNKESFHKKWEDRNLELKKIECGGCCEIKEINWFTGNQLKHKFPKCKKCVKNIVAKKSKKYLEENLKKEKLTCPDCGEEKPLSKFYKSGLNNKNPKCGKCHHKKARARFAKRVEDDPCFKEKEKIRSRIAKSLKSKNFKKNGTTEEYLGITKQGFVEYIESLFRDGMSWENREKWHLDHIIPLKTATTSEEIKKLWHYTNLQPLWDWENMEKPESLDWHHFEWAKDVLEKRKEIGLE